MTITNATVTQVEKTFRIDNGADKKVKGIELPRDTWAAVLLFIQMGRGEIVIETVKGDLFASMLIDFNAINEAITVREIFGDNEYTFNFSELTAVYEIK